MRRELLIASGVLVPFAVLVALGLRFASSEHAATAPPGALPANPPPVLTAAPPSDAAVGLPSSAPKSPAPAWVRPELAARVHQCLADADAGPVDVSVELLRDGGFGHVVPASQDPYLGACVTDVFEETGWEPTAAGTDAFGATTATFR